MAKSTVEEVVAHNLQVTIDQGPCLSYRYQKFVVARDPAKGLILIGGLGGLGVGQMWSSESERHKALPGYDEAPVSDAGEGSIAWRENVQREHEALNAWREANKGKTVI